MLFARCLSGPKTVQIKLADGKVASQDCPVAQIHVSTNIDKYISLHIVLLVFDSICAFSLRDSNLSVISNNTC